jgi:hypothetical protein
MTFYEENISVMTAGWLQRADFFVHTRDPSNLWDAQ